MFFPNVIWLNKNWNGFNWKNPGTLNEKNNLCHSNNVILNLRVSHKLKVLAFSEPMTYFWNNQLKL